VALHVNGVVHALVALHHTTPPLHTVPFCNDPVVVLVQLSPTPDVAFAANVNTLSKHTMDEPLVNVVLGLGFCAHGVPRVAFNTRVPLVEHTADDLVLLIGTEDPTEQFIPYAGNKTGPVHVLLVVLQFHD